MRRRAIFIGAGALALLIASDIWALFSLRGISWFVAWTIGLLFVHIIEGGIWHRICWGDKCPNCGTWVSVEDETVPGSPNMVRRTKTCTKCGWSDSWARAIKVKK